MNAVLLDWRTKRTAHVCVAYHIDHKYVFIYQTSMRTHPDCLILPGVLAITQTKQDLFSLILFTKATN